MIHWFNYNGKDSRDYGLYIISENAYDKPDRDISLVSVAGRSGDLIIDNGRYKNLSLTLKLRLVTEDYGEDEENVAFSRSLNAVMEWLKPSAGYFKYFDSYNPDYYRIACVSSGVSIDKKRKDIADLSVKLTCKPYKYRVDGDKTEIYTLSNNEYFDIENPEKEMSLPLIKVYTGVTYNASGNISHSFTITNGQASVTYTVKQINSYCYIDSEMMNVYKNTTNKNKDYTSDSFPVLYPGVNRITAISNVSKIEITPRWRTI